MGFVEECRMINETINNPYMMLALAVVLLAVYYLCVWLDGREKNRTKANYIERILRGIADSMDHGDEAHKISPNDSYCICEKASGIS